MHKYLQLWVCGHALTENVWNSEAMKLLLGEFLGQHNASKRPDNSFTCLNIYPFCPLHHTALTWFLAFQLFAYLSNHTLGSTVSCWKKKTRKLSFSYGSQPSRKLQHITCTLCGPCVGVSRATALIGDTKQATSEGKRGMVETELIELVDMALL